MNPGLWIARKNYLLILIKKVSNGYDGDDLDFLHAHCREVIENHPGELIEDAIRCYEGIVKEMRYLGG